MRLNSRLVVADACQYVKKGRKVESHIMFDSVSFQAVVLRCSQAMSIVAFRASICVIFCVAAF